MATTFVSAFYNLEKGVKITTYEKEIRDYFRRIDFLMSVPGPLIIFTEQEYVETIVSAAEKYRSERHDRKGYPTEIILKNWTDLYWVQNFQSILNVCLARDQTRMARTEHDDSPEFIPLMWEKLTFVQEAIAANKYASQYFAWIDFGLGRIPHYGNTLDAFHVKTPKIRFMLNNQQVFSESYYKNDVGVSTCAAGYITGSPEYFLKLLALFNAEAHNCLSNLKCCPREETILSNLVLKRPELFDTYFADENSCMLTNYSGYYHCSDILVHNLNQCLLMGSSGQSRDIFGYRCLERVQKVSKAILHAFDQDATNLTISGLFAIFQAYFHAASLLPDNADNDFEDTRENEIHDTLEMKRRFRSFLLFSDFRRLYDCNRDTIVYLDNLENLEKSSASRKEISIVCLIYKSAKYLQFVYDQIQKYTVLDDSREFFFVANDASPEVLAYLKDNDIPHTTFSNTPENIRAHGTTESYLNNVYRAWNHGGKYAKGKYVVFINSDMAFSPGWLEALLSKDPEKNAITSRLLESGRYPSGTHGKTFDCGRFLRDYDEQKFLSGAELLREPNRCEPSGLYMPLLIRRKYFLQVGGYPEGNIEPESDIFYPVIVKKGIGRCIPGDAAFMSKLETIGVSHVTAFDSIVYHFQNGEMFE